MNMFEALIPPDVKAAFLRVPEFVEQWTAFMNALGKRLGIIDGKLDSIDNKLQFLISETNITPELHENVVNMAVYDPRNVRRYD